MKEEIDMANLPTATKRARITKVAKDDGNYHVAQVDYMGKTCDVEIITPYGLYSSLPADAIAVLWNVQGQEENRVGIGNTPKTRFKNLQAGEVVVGSPQTESRVKFATDGSITVTGKNSATITVDSSGNMTFITQGTMSLTSTGDLTLAATGNVIINGAEIRLNGSSRGVARLTDTVNGANITSASSTVKTG